MKTFWIRSQVYQKSKPKIDDENEYDSIEEDLYYLENGDAIRYSIGHYYLLFDGNKCPLIFGCENQALNYLKNHPGIKVQKYDTIPETMAAGDQYMKLKHEQQNQKQVSSPKTVALQQEQKRQVKQVTPHKKCGCPRKNNIVTTNNKKNKAPAAIKITPVKEKPGSLNFFNCFTFQLNSRNLI